jgi:hypothetical protein
MRQTRRPIVYPAMKDGRASSTAFDADLWIDDLAFY